MTETIPEVTILMPVYNGERYLKAAIDSVLIQTFENFELLLINDGSTDGTQAIIESYDDPRIRVHVQKNQGVSRSLNQGISMVTSPYIRRHDADDISEPWMLEQQMFFLKMNPDISFVSTMCAYMSDRGKIANAYTQPNIQIFDNNDFVLANRSQFNPYSPIVHGTVLGPTQVFKEMGGYRTEFLTSEDNDLWLRIIEKYKFAILKSCPYYLRLSSNSATAVHKSSLTFYRELAYQFADERKITGKDLLQRGESMPKPIAIKTKVDKSEHKTGCYFRDDLLNYQYKVMLNAKDYKNVFKILKSAIGDGWKLSRTWKAILFPLLSQKFIKKGVKLKQAIKS